MNPITSTFSGKIKTGTSLAGFCRTDFWYLLVFYQYDSNQSQLSESVRLLLIQKIRLFLAISAVSLRKSIKKKASIWRKANVSSAFIVFWKAGITIINGQDKIAVSIRCIIRKSKKPVQHFVQDLDSELAIAFFFQKHN
jgi:hypothetical protein